jgi:hypothetical protein
VHLKYTFSHRHNFTCDALSTDLLVFNTHVFKEIIWISSFKSLLNILPRFQIVPSSALQKQVFSDRRCGNCYEMAGESELEARLVAGGFFQAQAYQLLSLKLQVFHEFLSPIEEQ